MSARWCLLLLIYLYLGTLQVSAVTNRTYNVRQISNRTLQVSAVTNRPYNVRQISNRTLQTDAVTNRTYSVRQISNRTLQADAVTNRTYSVRQISNRTLQVSAVTNRPYNVRQISNRTLQTDAVTNRTYSVRQISNRTLQADAVTNRTYSVRQISNRTLQTDAVTNRTYNVRQISNRTLQTDAVTNRTYNVRQISNRTLQADAVTNRTYNVRQISNRTLQVGAVTNRTYNVRQISNRTLQAGAVTNRTYSGLGIACAEPDSDSGNTEPSSEPHSKTGTARQANADFSAQRAFAILEKQCAFGPRPPGSAAHRETQNYLFTELQKWTNNVALQPVKHSVGARSPGPHKTLHLNNILAEFGPSSGETVLLAAHWDTRPIADHDPKPENREQPILGANDGASGVAVLLELARVFKAHPPPRRVVIVLFDGEDYGRTADDMFIGSRFFARNLGKWKPDYGILLDMVGDKDLTLPIEANSWNANQAFTAAIWDRAAALGLAPFQYRLGPAIMDDHVPLINAGIPMVDIIDFDYPYWHTVEDTVDKCSPKSLEVVATLVISVIYDGL